ncbi:hypothetical protein CR513_32006, partial [Mucuna pruriens]
MKKRADEKRKDQWESGFSSKLRHHRQQIVAEIINQKLAPKIFRSLSNSGKSYKLKLPNSSRIHPMFHMSQLKKAIGNYTVEAALPEGIEVELNEDEQPECVLACRDINEAGRTTKQWLIKWRGRTIEDTTWDDLVLKSQFPHFSLEDKATVKGEGSDRTWGSQVDTVQLDQLLDLSPKKP